MKSQVMSNIVRMLENEGPFKDVIYVILENVSKYLKMPDVTVMQYDEERTCLYPVLSYGGRHHLIQAAEVQAAAAQTAPQGTVERQVKAAADSPLYGEKLCYYRADTAQEPVRMALADANIKTSVTAPVKAEDKVRMYLCVSDSTNDVELDAEQLRFVSDVANVIQSIMQERISKDSLSYSYEVLKGILGSIDSGIMVYDRQTKEVLFENDIVKNCNDIKRVIQTCVTFYFTGENTKSIQEHCDAQSGSDRYTEGEGNMTSLTPATWASQQLLFNWLTAPDFIAYNYLTAPRTRTLSLIRKVWHAPCVAWTVREEQKEPLALARFDAVIFERYRPATYITPPIA